MWQTERGSKTSGEESSILNRFIHFFFYHTSLNNCCITPLIWYTYTSTFKTFLYISKKNNFGIR